MKPKCGTTYCDLFYGHRGDHRMAYVAPEPAIRIEWTGNIQVHIPIKPVKP